MPRGYLRDPARRPARFDGRRGLYDPPVPRLSRRASRVAGDEQRAEDHAEPERSIAEDPPADDAATSRAAPPPQSRRRTPTPAAQTGERIREIIIAAEQAAQGILREAEERLRDRVAEGDRAAEYRVQAAEEEAAEILGTARREASAVVSEAQRQVEQLLADGRAEAVQARADSDEQARRLLVDARATADGVRAEGLDLVGNLREMSNSLRSNAERLLQDVQRIHSRMVGQIDTAAAPGAPQASTRSAVRGDHREQAPSAGSGEVLDVPEFIPPE